MGRAGVRGRGGAALGNGVGGVYGGCDVVFVEDVVVLGLGGL